MRRTGILAIVLALLFAAPAAAQIPPIPTVVPTAVPTIPPLGEQPPEPGAYQADDGRGFRDILPSGTRGLYNAVDLAAFIATGRTQPHCCEQLGMYGNLVYATPGEASDQWCYDAVRQRPVGGATQPLIHWINRPTYQQVVEVQGPAGR